MVNVNTQWYHQFCENLPDVDTKDKIFVITGTTSGTGFVAARTVAAKGGTVVLLNRMSSRSKDSLAKLQQAVPCGTFVPIQCDLQNFASVTNAIETIKNRYDKIYCLANNAGIMATPDKATVDGYDTQMQTNHLSHFLLTAELYPLLEKGAEEWGEARIVNHSSFGRNEVTSKQLEQKYLEKNGGNLGGDSVGFMSGACFERYFQTKLANSVFSYGLHDKLQAKGSKVRAMDAHPGGSTTSLGDNLDYGFFWNMALKLVGPYRMQSPEDGAMGLIKGMLDPEAESGVLYGPANNATKGLPVPNPPEPYENDPESIDMLWRTSEAATGVKFEI